MSALPNLNSHLINDPLNTWKAWPISAPWSIVTKIKTNPDHPVVIVVQPEFIPERLAIFELVPQTHECEYVSIFGGIDLSQHPQLPIHPEDRQSLRSRMKSKNIKNQKTQFSASSLTIIGPWPSKGIMLSPYNTQHDWRTFDEWGCVSLIVVTCPPFSLSLSRSTNTYAVIRARV